MNVAQYMQSGATTLPPEAPLSVVRDTMDDHGFGLLLIVETEGALKGFITRSSLKDVKNWDRAVGEIAHPVRFSVTPEDTLEKAALILLSNRLVLLPVVRGDQLVGVLTQSELLRGLVHALGVGQAATRFTVTVPCGSADVYAVLDVVRTHGAHLVSVVQGGDDGSLSRLILRVQNVADKEALRADLEALLQVQDPA